MVRRTHRPRRTTGWIVDTTHRIHLHWLSAKPTHHGCGSPRNEGPTQPTGRFYPVGCIVHGVHLNQRSTQTIDCALIAPSRSRFAQRQSHFIEQNARPNVATWRWTVRPQPPAARTPIPIEPDALRLEGRLTVRARREILRHFPFTHSMTAATFQPAFRYQLASVPADHPPGFPKSRCAPMDAP